MPRRSRLLLSVIIVSLALAAAFTRPLARGASGGAVETLDTVEELRALEASIIAVAERARPSVVQLRGGGPRGVASGSGVIISEDGLVATCGHVGRMPGRPFTATLADGTELKARTLGQYFSNGIDCGLVQIETEGRSLPALPLGKSADLAIGDWVIALGYTHGLGETARPALLRAGRVLQVNEKELYIDAPIDAGDSGGPTITLRGEVVGLNSRCGTLSWQNVATPIDRLSERMELLREQREAEDAPAGQASQGRGRPPTGLPFPSGPDAGRIAVERSVPLAGAVRGAREATVAIEVDGARRALGLVVRSDGIVLTKASQLAMRVDGDSTISAIGIDGERWSLRELGRDAESDLLLLAPAEPVVAAAQRSRAVVPWSDGQAPVEPGTVLLTPHWDDRPPTLGFAAIEMRESDRDGTEGPYLGVQTRTSNARELRRAAADRAVTIMRVVDGTAASRAGLRPGQMILRLDDEEIGSPQELRAALGKRAVGASIRITRVDGAAADELTVLLGSRADGQQRVRRGNTATPISRRSTGFGELLAHDGVTEPEEMGGAVVDLDGRVVGVNIARFDRTATHALPADRVREVIDRIIDDAESNRVGLEIGSFNIRYANEADGSNAWSKRKDLVVAALADGDFWGLQEVLPEQREAIAAALPEYGIIGRGRDRDAATGEACPILYRKARWELDAASERTLWLSETPDVPGSKSWDASLPRIVTIARFTERATGRAIMIANLHLDHRGAESRQRAAEVVARALAAGRTDAAGEGTTPIVLLGDFNAGPTSPPLRTLLEDRNLDLADAWRAAHPEAPEQPTFNGWKDVYAGERIDFVLASRSLTVETATIATDRPDGRWPSDHAAVRVRFRW
jgi:S1-C subfamily serine protease